MVKFLERAFQNIESRSILLNERLVLLNFVENILARAFQNTEFWSILLNERSKILNPKEQAIRLPSLPFLKYLNLNPGTWPTRQITILLSAAVVIQFSVLFF